MPEDKSNNSELDLSREAPVNACSNGCVLTCSSNGKRKRGGLSLLPNVKIEAPCRHKMPDKVTSKTVSS